MSRHARQLQVPGVGEAGQRRLRAGSVAVEGEDLAAEVCARYLIGAGVGRLVASGALLGRLGGLDPEVRLDVGDGVPTDHRVNRDALAGAEGPVERGARAALRVVSSLLRAEPVR